MLSNNVSKQMNKIFTEFNTHRLYASNGQLIQCMNVDDAAAVNTGKSTYFYDTARGIVGKVFDSGAFDDRKLLKAYDYNQYEQMCFSDQMIREIIDHFK